MTTLVIRYQTSDEGAEEVANATKEVFAALEGQQPKGIRFSYYRVVGSADFVAVLELAEGVENPLPGIEAARQLQATVAEHAVGASPAPQPVHVLGSYDGAR